MRRSARRAVRARGSAGAAALLGLGLAANAALAQGLPALSVTALSMRADRTTIAPGVAFHVTIHLHATQPHADLVSLVLPETTNLTILGDEKHTSPRPDGTDYEEVLTVAGIALGEATLSPAFIDARDPSRGGKPFRFSSNALHVRVTAESPAPELRVWRALGTAFLWIVAAIAIVALAIFALGFSARVRRRPADYVTLPPARPVAPSPPARPVDRAAPVRAAATTLRATPNRANAAALRAALFAFADARSEETLGSLLERVPVSESALRAALRTAERATFVDEANLHGAIEDLLDGMRRMGYA